jgi:hypothetical protein
MQRNPSTIMWIAGTGVFELQRTTVYLGETFLRGVPPVHQYLKYSVDLVRPPIPTFMPL